MTSASVGTSLPRAQPLDGAGLKLIAAGMQQCLTPTGAGRPAPMSVAPMERPFPSLA